MQSKYITSMWPPELKKEKKPQKQQKILVSCFTTVKRRILGNDLLKYIAFNECVNILNWVLNSFNAYMLSAESLEDLFANSE